jgi:hypothetical protein
MANVSRIRGFRPIRHLDGSPYNDAAVPYLITEATATFIGDIVIDTGTAAAAGVTAGGVDCEGMQIAAHSTLTTTGVGNLGVVVGFVAVDTLPKNYRVASAVQVVLVCTDPSVVYEVQEDGVGNNIAAADLGNNFAFTSGAGSTVTGASAYSLDSSGTSTAATYPLRVLGLVKRPDNTFGLSSTDLAKFEVMFNDSRVGAGTAGI